VTLVINPVLGCCYFPPGPRLLFQPKRSPLGWYREPEVVVKCCVRNL